MLHFKDPDIRDLLLKGNFGLERESLRILPDGTFAHTPHPFPADDPNITRDFCENQTEVNTGVSSSPEAAVQELATHTARIQKALATREAPELLWPFSNPPYILDEDDIPVASFTGDRASKTTYREYLSAKYGRYKMTLSGIHFNYSFSDELLQKEFDLLQKSCARISFDEFKNQLYVELAEKATAYGWIVTALTASSPIADLSLVERGHTGEDFFPGMSSIRCSELGYWNDFAPVFDYSDICHYADSIEHYVKEGFLKAPSELYFPIRLKPPGLNRLDSLRKYGINHIELRMFDLNPLCLSGLDVRDVAFAQLFLMYLTALPPIHLTESQQTEAVQNFKNAAHYDLRMVKLTMDGRVYTIRDAARQLLSQMKTFYASYGGDVIDILDFEMSKILNPDERYAARIWKEYSGGFVEKGLELAKSQQAELLRQFT